MIAARKYHTAGIISVFFYGSPKIKILRYKYNA